MEKRIVVRTTSNVSYIGNVCCKNRFDSEGIVVAPNPNLKMEIFIPKEEILELIYDGNVISYDIYVSM